jgi:hypothetical protein
MSAGRIVCSAVLLMLLAAESAGQSVGRAVLDVPFVPQSEALCGGAAAAMVLRYWGTRSVHAEDFAPLVDESAEGIQLGALSRAITGRGWRATPFSGTPTDVQRHLSRGRPVIALVEDRPGRYHYVVVVAWTSDRVVVHDPAYGPFRVSDVGTFEHAWAVTKHASLLVLPAVESPGAAPTPVAGPQPAADACSPLLHQAVRLAREGDMSNAERLLLVGRETCPGSGAADRELAGIRFLQRRWTDAAELAREAVARDPSDMHAWQLLATARFLTGDAAGALQAWNQRDEPRVDLARVEGLDRLPHHVVANLLDLDPDDVLTDRKLARARRRVSSLPALQTARVSFTPQADGRATIDVAVLERPLVPQRWQALAAIGVHSAVRREARLEFANATASGELWTASWRWWANRPRVAVALAIPTFAGATGLWRVEGSWERQTYLAVPNQPGASTPDGLIASERRRAGLSFGDWASGELRWQVRGGLDRWVDRGSHVSAGGAIERRLGADRIALGAEGAIWRPMGGNGDTFAAGSLSMAWRTTPARGHRWTATAGLHGVSASAPLDLWPSAGTGEGRPLLLRAHPLLHDGIIRAAEVTRVLAHGTLERKQPLSLRPPAPLWWAVFVDVAGRPSSHSGAERVMMIDVGTGLRLDLPGTPDVLRLDVARGIRDGNTALSVGWQTAWPGW